MSSKTSTISASFGSVQKKLEQLKTLRKKIEGLKVLYAQHDALMNEVLQEFIEITPERIVFHREIQVGTKKYRIIPFFYDPKKGQIKTKIWKSTAFETASLE